MDLPMDGYVRVSRVGGRTGESFISPDVQRSQIAKWADLRGVRIAEWHTDLDQSGGKIERPGLDVALERVEAGLSGGIVVAKWDRFARTLAGGLEAIRRLDEAGGVLASVAEGIDPTTPAGKFQRGVFLLLAEFHLDQLRESWAIAQREAVARGVHISSRTPTGYIRRGDGRLEPHPGYAPIIGEVFRLRAGGASWRELCDHLDRHHVVGPYGAANWTTRAVQGILTNRVYLGEARSGANVNREAHAPLIDRGTWELAQTAKGVAVPRSGRPALLAGLLRCGGCRYLLKPDTMKLRDGTRVRIYRCRGHHAAGVCEDRSAVLERVIWPHVEAAFFAHHGNLTATGVEQTAADIDRLEGLADTAEAELAAYRDDERIVTTLGGERYLDGLRTRVERADTAARELAQARKAAGGGTLDVDLAEIWPDLDVGEKQKLLGAAWDCIVLRSGRKVPIEDRVLFVASGDAPADLPRRGKRPSLAPWPLDGPGTVWKPGA